MKAYVYILYSKTFDKYYIGSTTNLEERLKHHLGGHTPSTHRMGEVELKFSQLYDSLDEARIIEKRLKMLKRRTYIEKIINDGFIRMRA